MLLFAVLVSLVSLLAAPAAAEESNTVCALTDGNIAYRWTGSIWEVVLEYVGNIYGGGHALVMTDTANTIAYARYPGQRLSIRIGAGGLQFAVSNYDIFGLSGSHNQDGVYRFQYGTTWEKIGSGAKAIYCGQNSLFAVTPDNTEIFYWNGSPNNWSKAGGGGTMFAVWRVNVLIGLGGGPKNVYEGYSYGGPEFSWYQIGSPASRVFAGGYGIYAVNPANTEIWEYNFGAWYKRGGGGKDFAVTSEGLYGLSTDGHVVYKWSTGESWNSLGGPPGVTKKIVPCPI